MFGYTVNEFKVFVGKNTLFLLLLEKLENEITAYLNQVFVDMHASTSV